MHRLATGEGTSDGTSKGFLGWHPDFVRHSAAKSTTLIESLAGPDFGDSAFLADHNNIIAAAIKESEDEPKTIAEARSRPDWPRWKEAMDREIKTLEGAGTWKMVLRLPGKNIVGSKWVFKIKRKADGSIDKYKARVIACGFTQIFGVDYFDTFSPVARLASFRVLMALTARFG